MNAHLRAQLESKAPGLINCIRALRNRFYFYRTFSAFQKAAKEKLYPAKNLIVVQTGPFRGLHYLNETVWGSITPKWLGSYEEELHSIIDQIVKCDYAIIIDVGCAEGYYAVGFAVVIPKSKVIAFDTDFISRKQLSRLARLNQVADRIEIKAYCDFADINALSIQRKTLIICDIEGYEAHLLDPEKAGSLNQSDILVEVHESSNASQKTEDLLVARFAPSHNIKRVVATDRAEWINQYIKLNLNTEQSAFLKEAAEEHRISGRVWLWMKLLNSNC